jgi:hypothetical protein
VIQTLTNSPKAFLSFLFSNTKLRKYIPQQILRGDYTSDFSEVVEGFADVDGKEVARDIVVEALADFD